MRKLSFLGLICSICAIMGGCTKDTSTVTGTTSISEDMTWTLRTTGVPDGFIGSGSPLRIVWGNNQFLVVGYDTTLTSIDGKTWVAHTSNLPYSYTYTLSVVWGANTLVALEDSSIFTSSDGFTWTKSYSSPSSNLNAVTWGGNKFVAVGTAIDLGNTLGNAIVSSDGINWVNNPMGMGNPVMITWGNNRYVALAQGIGYTSGDAVNWSQDSINLNVENRAGLNSIVFGNNLFVTVQGNALSTSPDGINWTGVANGGFSQAYALNTVLWDGSRFIVAGNSVLTSTDGTNWMIQPQLTGSWEIYEMAAANNSIVGLTDNGIVTSP